MSSSTPVGDRVRAGQTLQRVSIVILGGETRIVVANTEGDGGEGAIAVPKPTSLASRTWSRMRGLGGFVVGAATVVAAFVTVWALVR